MIVLDTNVVSELLRPAPDSRVLSWHRFAEEADILTITAVTKAELLYGLERMPAGRRKQRLETGVRSVLSAYDERHILPFSSECAEPYSVIVSSRQAQGRPISVLDAQIASICVQTGAALATRDELDFLGVDLAVVNPWTAEQHP